MVKRTGGPSLHAPENGLDFAPHLFDGIQVRRIRRKEHWFSSCRPYRINDCRRLVRTEIVHHDGVSGPQTGNEHLPDISKEHGFVRRGIDGHAGRFPVSPDGADERADAPVSVGCGIVGPLAAGGAPVEARHLGRDAGLVEEENP